MIILDKSAMKLNNYLGAIYRLSQFSNPYGGFQSHGGTQSSYPCLDNVNPGLINL